MHAQRVLKQYGDLPSIQGIKSDCNVILKELREELRQQFCYKNTTTKEMTDSVDLLLQLDEPAEQLCEDFLKCAEQRLGEQLVMLKDQSEQKDISEFMDLGCNGFFNDLCLVVASFYDMFINNTRTSDNIENR